MNNLSKYAKDLNSLKKVLFIEAVVYSKVSKKTNDPIVKHYTDNRALEIRKSLRKISKIISECSCRRDSYKACKAELYDRLNKVNKILSSQEYLSLLEQLVCGERLIMDEYINFIKHDIPIKIRSAIMFQMDELDKSIKHLKLLNSHIILS